MEVLGWPAVFSTEYIDMELPMVLCDHAPCKSGLPSGRRTMGPPLTSCGDTYGFPFNSGFTGRAVPLGLVPEAGSREHQERGCELDFICHAEDPSCRLR